MASTVLLVHLIKQDQIRSTVAFKLSKKAVVAPQTTPMSGYGFHIFFRILLFCVVQMESEIFSHQRSQQVCDRSAPLQFFIQIPPQLSKSKCAIVPHNYALTNNLLLV